jgi:hypothetical protein
MKRLCGVVVATTVLSLGCASEPEAPATPAFEPTPHANLAQLMRGIPFPASNIIFDTQTTDPAAAAEPTDPVAGQGATAQFSGVYGGWQAVENAALALSETANLIMVPGRMCENGRPVPLDQEDYRMWAANLAAAGEEALKAAQSRNLDAMVDVSGTLSDACAQCHEVYRDKPDNADRCVP